MHSIYSYGEDYQENIGTPGKERIHKQPAQVSR